MRSLGFFISLLFVLFSVAQAGEDTVEMSFSSMSEKGSTTFSANGEDREKLPAPVFSWMVNNFTDLEACTTWVQSQCEGEFNIVGYSKVEADKKLAGFVILQRNHHHTQERKLVFLVNPEGELVSMRAGREDVVTVSAADFETKTLDETPADSTAKTDAPPSVPKLPAQELGKAATETSSSQLR